jgi:hypothetical protein
MSSSECSRERPSRCVAGVDEGVRRGCEDAACAAGREDRRLRLEDENIGRLHLERCDADDVAVRVADRSSAIHSTRNCVRARTLRW